jgi:HPt (histidine-containing phosphotransfer) domain-containing protein
VTGVIDENVLEELQASVEGDIGFVRDLVDAYISDSAEQVSGIEAALAAGDAEALVRPAHTLKSSSATLGAIELSATARTLEQAARAGDLSDADTHRAAASVRVEWEAAIAALKDWVARTTGA